MKGTNKTEKTNRNTSMKTKKKKKYTFKGILLDQVTYLTIW